MKRLLAIAVLAAAGCPASHGGYPSTACKVPADCFAGEACVNQVCVPAADAAAAVDSSTVNDLAGGDGADAQ